MSPFEILLLVYAGVLAAAALAVVYRMIVGPTILDRAISSDSLVTLVVMGMALYAAQSRAAWAGPAMLALTGLAFIGTVTFARFVAREDPRQGRRRHHPHEPSTDTGPHEAIHPDPTGAAADEVPENRFEASPENDPWDTQDDLVDDPEHPGEPTTREQAGAGTDGAGRSGAGADDARDDGAAAEVAGAGDADDEVAGAGDADDDSADEDSATGFGADPYGEGANRWPEEPIGGGR
jgi:multicomponent Na+:H+ antiporter subunit F